MYKLKANKKKGSRLAKVETTYIVKVGSINTLNPHLSLLSNFFASDFFFSILPNIISSNMPVLFL